MRSPSAGTGIDPVLEDCACEAMRMQSETILENIHYQQLLIRWRRAPGAAPDQRPSPMRHVACTAPARAHMVAPGGCRPRHPIPRRLPEITVKQADRGC